MKRKLFICKLKKIRELKFKLKNTNLVKDQKRSLRSIKSAKLLKILAKL